MFLNKPVDFFDFSKNIQIEFGYFDKFDPENKTKKTSFPHYIFETLNNIDKNSIGHRLLQKINNGKHKITIRFDLHKTFTSVESISRASIRGQGCPSTIFTNCLDSTCLGFGKEISAPFEVKLLHELLHAFHAACGKRAREKRDICLKLWLSEEEYKTIFGLPSKKLGRTSAKLTENAYRQEANLPLRFSHLKPTDLNTEKRYFNFAVNAQLAQDYMFDFLNIHSNTKAPSSIVSIINRFYIAPKTEQSIYDPVELVDLLDETEFPFDE